MPRPGGTVQPDACRCRLPESERTALLDEECGDDLEVRSTVLRMLREDARSDSFLATTAFTPLASRK